MRRVPVVLIAASVSVLAVGGLSAKYVLGGSSAPAQPAASSELTTGSVDGRWPKADSVPSGAAPAAQPAPTVQPVAATPPAPEKPVAAPKQVCSNPGALGISRTVQIDTAGGPGVGMSQYRDYDFLQPGEVVLTFDDGPWPVTTPAVLAALDAECVKAVFFPIGKHSTWHPAVLKQVIAAGHTVGSHTWGHVNLAKKPLQEAKDEIEQGMSAVALMAGQPIAPFFRFPQLRQTPELKAYLAERNIGTFSIDIDSEDFRIHKPDVLVNSVMTKLKKTGKGILLMHDLHKWTAAAVPDLLRQLKAGGYKIVFIRAKDTLATLPAYDAAIAQATTVKTSSNARPIGNVIQTVQ